MHISMYDCIRVPVSVCLSVCGWACACVGCNYEEKCVCCACDDDPVSLTHVGRTVTNTTPDICKCLLNHTAEAARNHACVCVRASRVRAHVRVCWRKLTWIRLGERVSVQQVSEKQKKKSHNKMRNVAFLMLTLAQAGFQPPIKFFRCYKGAS